MRTCQKKTRIVRLFLYRMSQALSPSLNPTLVSLAKPFLTRADLARVAKLEEMASLVTGVIFCPMRPGHTKWETLGVISTPDINQIIALPQSMTLILKFWRHLIDYYLINVLSSRLKLGPGPMPVQFMVLMCLCLCVCMSPHP